MNKAGYNPEIVPTIKGDKNNGIRICHLINIFTERLCAEILLSQGSRMYNKANASKIAAHVINTDSLRNCVINSFFLAPTTFRMPISLARSADLAVERFM